MRLTAIILLLASVATAHAQNYPSKPTRIVVGFTAGGPSDIVARIVAQQLTDRLGQSFIVENRVGATGTIGAEIVAKAPPDGYALYLASQTTHAVAPYMYAKVGYDPIKDFATVVRVVHNPLLMVVNPSFPVKTVKDLITLAKARPGQINFATGGIGSSPHMSMELFKQMTKIDMVPVHYKGDGAAIIDIVGGQVPMLTSSMSALMPYVKSEKMRGIAVTGLKRSTVAPEFPTIAESGLPGFEAALWDAVMVPTGTAPAIVERLNAELDRIVRLPEVTDQLRRQGFAVATMPRAALMAYIRSEIAKWRSVVEKSGARAD
ncbi:MAG TPA: hypothetical protein DHW34_04570 [Actinobacteria bacterium]|nr:hypothetical protein [Actinomycetota bacterium]